MKSCPVCTVFRALRRGLRGGICFPENLIGRVLTMADGQKLIVLQQVEIKGASGGPVRQGAVFRIRFRFTAGLQGSTGDAPSSPFH